MSDEKSRVKNVAGHILPTSGNLLGICFLIFGMVHQSGQKDTTTMDDVAVFAIVLFLLASIFSYISIRSDKGSRFEQVADRFFIAGLCLLGICSLLMAFKLLQ